MTAPTGAETQEHPEVVVQVADGYPLACGSYVRCNDCGELLQPGAAVTVDVSRKVGQETYGFESVWCEECARESLAGGFERYLIKGQLAQVVRNSAETQLVLVDPVIAARAGM